MKVKAVRPFKDKENNNTLREPGKPSAEFDCTPERFKELQKGGYVVEVKAEKPEVKAEKN